MREEIIMGIRMESFHAFSVKEKRKTGKRDQVKWSKTEVNVTRKKRKEFGFVNSFWEGGKRRENSKK